ncbi:MAG: hypothetical protein IJ542_00015 [Clostridia bacterium]|nr:hypothetical protein [Clostridia bacterium]
MDYIIIISIGWLVCGAICAFVASAKNRTALGWFFTGCLFGLLAVIIIFALSPLDSDDDLMEENDESISFVCNECRQQILIDKKDLKNIDTIVCSNCGNEIQLNHGNKNNNQKRH